MKDDLPTGEEIKSTAPQTLNANLSPAASEEQPTQTTEDATTSPQTPDAAQLPELPAALLADAPAASDEAQPTLAEIPRSSSAHRSLIVRLACCMLATLATVILGTHAASLARRTPPLREAALEAFLGARVARRETEQPETGVSGTVTDTVPDTAHDTSETTEESSLPPEDGNVAEDVIEVDLSVSPEQPFALVDLSGYEPDCEALLESATLDAVARSREKYGETAPCVLILHTHGTEAYSDCAENGYRSLDAEQSVVALGRLVKEILASHGIASLHIEEMLDADSFDDAYARGAEMIRESLAETPSVCCVIDIHRDAVSATDGTPLRPLSSGTMTPDGTRAAQLMLVVGTDAAGSSHAGWRENLAFALAVQRSALDFDPSIMRAINLRAESFNQQYAPYSIIIEVGSAANTLEEARLGATIAAEALSRVLTEGN